VYATRCSGGQNVIRWLPGNTAQGED